MTFVRASNKILDVQTWNGSHGNKLLNLFAVAKFADLHNIPPVLPDNYSSPFVDYTAHWQPSNGETKFRIIEDRDPFYIGKILYPAAQFFGKFFNFSRAVEKNIRNIEANIPCIFNERPTASTELQGFFFDARYQIDQRIFEKYFTPKYSGSENFCNASEHSENKICIVHVRGTDFKQHLLWAYPNSICLPASYYKRAFKLVEDFAATNVDFQVVTDDIPYAKSLLHGLRCSFIEESTSVRDWHLLRTCSYRIESNSTFCWTAGSCNSKCFSVFPKYGYGRVGGVQYPVGYRFSSPSVIPLKYPK